MSDVISNPSHYTKGRKYEPRKVIEDWDLDFYLGNALKYISRAGRKNNAIEDLKKAKQYLDFEIEKLENNANYRFGVSNTFVTLPYIKDDCMNITLNGAPYSTEHHTPKYMFEYAMTDIDVSIGRCKVLPDSKEKSIAITKLEEAQMLIKRAMDNSND